MERRGRGTDQRWFSFSPEGTRRRDIVPASSLTEAMIKRRLATGVEGDGRELLGEQLDGLRMRTRLKSTLPPLENKLEL